MLTSYFYPSLKKKIYEVKLSTNSFPTAVVYWFAQGIEVGELLKNQFPVYSRRNIQVKKCMHQPTRVLMDGRFL
jgi:hypothetical protein